MDWGTLIGKTTTLQWILIGLFLVALLVQFRTYLFVYLRLSRYTPPSKRKTSKPVSVVICAKNEEENLRQFLPRVLEQEYPDFEVVVVNDSSTDDTDVLLAELSARYSHLRYTSIPANEKFLHGKKLALTIGLKAARHPHVVLTDADCYPLSDQWLQILASRLTGETKIVLGYGGYERHRGLLNVIIRYETVFTALQYLSHAITGKPYMGVGRNLAYEKALFFDNKGFAGHYHLASGDDDLFVNRLADKKNTAVVFNSEAQTRSIPEKTFRNWIHQKQRHLSAGKYYKKGTRIRLAVEMITRMLVYVNLVIISILTPWKYIIIGLFALWLATRLTVLKMGMRSLDEKYLLLPSLLLDPLLPLVLGIIWMSGVFVTKYQPWN